MSETPGAYGPKQAYCRDGGKSPLEERVAALEGKTDKHEKWLRAVDAKVGGVEPLTSLRDMTAANFPKPSALDEQWGTFVTAKRLAELERIERDFKAMREDRDAFQAKVVALEASRDNWKETARRAHNDIEYYQGLLDRCAKHLGGAVFIADDGTRSDSPLRAKVPELVAALEAAERFAGRVLAALNEFGSTAGDADTCMCELGDMAMNAGFLCEPPEWNLTPTGAALAARAKETR